MLSRSLVLLSCACSVYALVPIAQGAPLPASVRACAAEADPGRRLACYDREIAAQSQIDTAVGSRAAAGPLADRRADAKPANEPAREAQGSEVAPAGHAQAGSDVARGREAQSAMAPPGDAQVASSVRSAKEVSTTPRHVAAHVASVDYAQGDIVVHLDNGQVWEQLQDADTDLNLRAGDAVTIDKSLGDYWLSGHQGGVMKVKQRN